jgi:Family of unknown function (DUF6503)
MHGYENLLKIQSVIVIVLYLAVPSLSPAQVEPPTSAGDTKQPSASELLTCSIAYHDPNGSWQQGEFKITDISSRPDGTTGRRTIVRLHNGQGRFALESHFNDHVVTAAIKGNVVHDVRLDGRLNFSNDEIEQYQLAPAQILNRRNFFLYLLGLPMKLTDHGTKLDPKVKTTNFRGTSVYELRVTYEAIVGGDTWYFYLDRNTCALVGHRFYHNESARDGEYAVLREEVAGQGLRLPRVRKWYRNQDDEWFITHTIESIETP